jgi:hypothetical protein
LNRLELSQLAATRYRKISHNPVAIKNLLVGLFLEAHERAPKQIVLDLDVTDDPCMASRRGGSSTATTATAICRFTYSAPAICWSPSCGAPPSTRRPARWGRWRVSSHASAPGLAGSARLVAEIASELDGVANKTVRGVSKETALAR